MDPIGLALGGAGQLIGGVASMVASSNKLEETKYKEGAFDSQVGNQNAFDLQEELLIYGRRGLRNSSAKDLSGVFNSLTFAGTSTPDIWRTAANSNSKLPPLQIAGMPTDVTSVVPKKLVAGLNMDAVFSKTNIMIGGCVLTLLLILKK